MMHHQCLSSPSPLPSCDSCSDTSTEIDDRDPHTHQQSHLIPPYLLTHYTSKAKSSLCRNFTQKGVCPYGKKCQFAHGPQELRINMDVNRCYKTKGCHAFAKNGYCCYGSRCNFIHHQPLTPNTPENWSTIYCNHRETVKLGRQDGRSKLLQLLGK